MSNVTPVNKTEEVDAFMSALEHPFKKEVAVLREIIKGVNADIIEEVKWSAPSFSYKDKDYIVTFNLWEKKRVHLVFHNPEIVKIKSDLLEGEYEHRRMAFFSNMKDVEDKRKELERIIKELVTLMDKS